MLRSRGKQNTSSDVVDEASRLGELEGLEYDMLVTALRKELGDAAAANVNVRIGSI